MRSYSARLIVCLPVLVESSTMKVERVLRASTRAFTTTLPNSVFWLFGISSVSSRSRSAGGFHSVVAAFSSYATTAPPSRARLPLDAGRDAPALAIGDSGSVPRHRGINYPRSVGCCSPPWTLSGDGRRPTARSQLVFITGRKAYCQANGEFGLDQSLNAARGRKQGWSDRGMAL